MNRKTTALATALLVAFTLGVQAQLIDGGPLDDFAKDLQLIFDELGGEVVPNLQTASILNHGLGSAELGSFPHMYLSFSAGGTVGPGLLKFTNSEDDADWQNFFLVNELLDSAGVNDSEVRDITDNYAPFPSMRVSYGVGIADGYELSLQAGIVPQAAADLAGEEALTATLTTLGGRLRKVLVRQDRGVPAISVGIGYVYSGIGFGYDLADLDPLSDSEDPEQVLRLGGDAVFDTQTHSFGVDVRTSTRLARVIYPFIGLSAYYQNSTYEAGIDNFTITQGTGDPQTTATQPFSSQTFNAFNVVLNSGMDFKLSIINLFAHVNYAVGTRAPGGIVGLRFQI